MSVQKELVNLGQKLIPSAEEKDFQSTSVEGVIKKIAENYTPSEGAQGPKGDPGVGIKSITGSIDGSNKLTLTITLTDDSQQTVEGNITPPAAG